MIVISDTTPLTYLLQIEHAFLLQRLYEKIIIPTAVQDELLRYVPTKNAAQELFQAGWVSVQTPASLISLPASTATDIGSGEWEALSLAVELQANLVLIDERLATVLANRLHIKTIGLLGILIEAKVQGHIFAVKPLLDQLVAKRFFINKSLYNKIISLVNE